MADNSAYGQLERQYGRACDEVTDLRAKLAAAERERDEARRLHSDAEGQIVCRNELWHQIAVAERTAAEERHLADVRGEMLTAALAREEALRTALRKIEGEWDASPAVKAIVRKALDTAHDAATKGGG